MRKAVFLGAVVLFSCAPKKRTKPRKAEPAAPAYRDARGAGREAKPAPAPRVVLSEPEVGVPAPAPKVEAVARGAEVKVLADFEDGSGGLFAIKGARVVDSPELDGKALHMKKGSSLSFWSDAGEDWSGYDCLRFDVYNPTGDRVIVPITIKDSHYGQGYFWWVNRRFPALRGKGAVTVDMTKLARGEGRARDPKDAPAITWDKIVQVIIGGPTDIGEFYVDNVRLEKADLTPPPAPGKLVLADFEDGTTGQLEGRKGVKVVYSDELSSRAARLPAKGALVYERPGSDWSAYDYIRLDLYNPGKENAKLHICIKDDSAPHGYYSWINRYPAARPGKSTLELAIKGLRRGELSPKDFLDQNPFHWDNFWQFIFSADGELYVDNVRLEKAEARGFEGFFAFDFGPARSPLLTGYTQVTPETGYDVERGYGWKTKGSYYARVRSYPSPADDFFADWISFADWGGAGSGNFAVDVPNGDYKVWVAWHDPGEWGFVQNFTRRSVAAEGKVLISETMTGEQFLDALYRDADWEDRPGDDFRAKYQDQFVLRPFEVTVGDGQLNIELRGNSQYAATVNGIVIYPMEKEARGDELVAAGKKMRREQYYARRMERLIPREEPDPGLAVKNRDRGYVLFQRGKENDITYFSAPQAGQELTGAMTAFACRGEYEPFVFCLYALRDLQGLNFEISPLRSDAGAEIPAGRIEARYVPWKFRFRGESHQAEYFIAPVALRKMKPIEAAAGSARRFWVTVRVPGDAEPGVYKGRITVKAAGVPRTAIPVELEVLPITLPGADIGLGAFNTGYTRPGITYAFKENAAFIKDGYRKCVSYAREFGFNYVSISHSWQHPMFRGMEGTKPKFDLAEAGERYRICRELGYAHVDIFAPADGLFTRAAETDDEAARKAGFASAAEMLKVLYGGFQRACRGANLPEPIWCFGDEPPDSAALKWGAMYRRVRDLAGARTLICYSPHGEPTQKLLDILTISCLNVTTPSHMARARKAGNHLYVNNQGSNRWAYGVWMHKLRSMGVEAYRQFSWYTFTEPNRRHEMRPTEKLLRVREGVDDYRYLQLMRDLATRKSGHRKAAEAMRFYDGLMRKADFENTRDGRKAKMNDEELNLVRRRAAEYIMALSAG